MHFIYQIRLASRKFRYGMVEKEKIKYLWIIRLCEASKVNQMKIKNALEISNVAE